MGLVIANARKLRRPVISVTNFAARSSLRLLEEAFDQTANQVLQFFATLRRDGLHAVSNLFGDPDGKVSHCWSTPQRAAHKLICAQLSKDGRRNQHLPRAGLRSWRKIPFRRQVRNGPAPQMAA